MKGSLVDQLVEGGVQHDRVCGGVRVAHDGENGVTECWAETDAEHHPEGRNTSVGEGGDRVRNDMGVLDGLGFEGDWTNVEMTFEAIGLLFRRARGDTGGGVGRRGLSTL